MVGYERLQGRFFVGLFVCFALVFPCSRPPDDRINSDWSELLST